MTWAEAGTTASASSDTPRGPGINPAVTQCRVDDARDEQALEPRRRLAACARRTRGAGEAALAARRDRGPGVGRRGLLRRGGGALSRCWAEGRFHALGNRKVRLPRVETGAM